MFAHSHTHYSWNISNIRQRIKNLEIILYTENFKYLQRVQRLFQEAEKSDQILRWKTFSRTQVHELLKRIMNSRLQRLRCLLLRRDKFTQSRTSLHFLALNDERKLSMGLRLHGSKEKMRYLRYTREILPGRSCITAELRALVITLKFILYRFLERISIRPTLLQQ